MSHSERHIENRLIRAKQKAKEGRIRRNGSGGRFFGSYSPINFKHVVSGKRHWWSQLWNKLAKGLKKIRPTKVRTGQNVPLS